MAYQMKGMSFGNECKVCGSNPCVCPSGPLKACGKTHTQIFQVSDSNYKSSFRGIKRGIRNIGKGIGEGISDIGEFFGNIGKKWKKKRKTKKEFKRRKENLKEYGNIHGETIHTSPRTLKTSDKYTYDKFEGDH